MALSGDVAYVAADTAGLLVFDIRDPFQPVLINAVAGDPDLDDDLDIALTSRLTIDGDFAYVVQTRHERSRGWQTDLLTVYDLRSPTAPQLRGAVALRVATAEPGTTGFGGTGITVRSGFAYLPRSASGVQVVDVRHPDAPHLVSVLDTPSKALQVTTANDLIYVVGSVFGLQVIQGLVEGLIDSDGDGVIDFFDRFPLDPTNFQDLDGDGVRNNADPHDVGRAAEVAAGTDPAVADTDSDGLSNAAEQTANATAAVDLITNGGFESEGGSVRGWTASITSGGPGGWSALQDSLSPVRQYGLPLPPEGSVAEIADAVSARILTLRQEITIPPATSVMLGVDVLAMSGLPFLTPEAFNLEIGLPLSHQFRIDLLQPEAPQLAVGDDVLAPLFRTETDDPVSGPYQRLLFDLTPSAGRRLVLRFAYNQGGVGLVTGIDNVRVLASGVSP